MIRNDLISRGELVNAIADKWDKGEILAVIQSMEAVDPVKHGEWMYKDYQLKCSSCKRDFEEVADLYEVDYSQFAYCPFCGARMDS